MEWRDPIEYDKYWNPVGEDDEEDCEDGGNRWNWTSWKWPWYTVNHVEQLIADHLPPAWDDNDEGPLREDDWA